MPFLSRASEASDSAGVETEIKVKIKFNLKHRFSAGDKEDSPEQKELDNALAKVWDQRGESELYEKNLMDDEEDDDVWVEDRSTYDDDTTNYDSDEEREEADDDRSARAGEVIPDDYDDAVSYAVMSTHEETEIKLEEIRSAEMEHAEAYLDSVLRRDSESKRNENVEQNDEDASDDETKEAPSKEDMSIAIVRYDNQDYFLKVLSHVGKEYISNEDVDKTVDIVEDNPYEKPTMDELHDDAEEEDQIEINSLQNEDNIALGDRWLKDISQLFLLQGLFPETHQQGQKQKDDILGASDAMTRKIKGLVSPLLELGYDSKKFYIDDDVQSSSSDDLSEEFDFENENDGQAVRPNGSLPDEIAIKDRTSTTTRGRQSTIPRKGRSKQNEHAFTLQRASSSDSVLSERSIGPAERHIANFLKTHLGLDLYDNNIGDREYRTFVSAHFKESGLLNYQRMRQHMPGVSRTSTNSRQITQSKSTDGQGRRRKTQRKPAESKRTRTKKTSKKYQRAARMEV